jgi:predicted dehydrogenase
MRVAFVGSSHVHAQDYLGVCHALPWVDLVGIARADPETQGILTNLPPGVPAQRDLPSHDLAVVLTDIASHDEVCAEVEAPAVFLEKPLAVDGPRAARLARSLSEAGKRVEVGFFLRHSRALSAMIEAVQDPTLGPVRFARFAFAHSGLRDGWLRS